MSSSQPTRARGWCFTWHEEKLEPVWDEKVMDYLVYQKELTKTGGEHWQGFVYFKNPRRMGGVSKLFPGAHLEVARGTGEQNKQYCTKTDSRAPGASPQEFGRCPKSGDRTDLKEIARVVWSGVSNFELAEQCPDAILRYPTGIKELRLTRMAARKDLRPPLEVEVKYGPTGTGKTYSAMEENPGAFLWYPTVPEWWDGYDQEKTLVIDEYHHQLPLTRLLRVLDRYQLQLPIKGSHTYAQWTKVVLTSNVHPREWYPNCREDQRLALMRRITKVTEMLIPWQPELSSSPRAELHVLNAGEPSSPVIAASPPSLRILRRALEVTEVTHPLIQNHQPQSEEEWDQYDRLISSYYP